MENSDPDQLTPTPTARHPAPPQDSIASAEAFWTPAYVLVLAVQFFFGISFSTFFVLPKYLIRELGASADLVGNSHGVFALAGVLLVPFAGRWLDHFGRKAVLMAGLVLATVTYFPFEFVRTPTAILALRFLHGISFTLVFTAGSALTLDLAPTARRAEAIGYFGTAMLATNAFGPTTAEFLAGRFGWARVFEACSVYSLLALFFAVLLVPPRLPSSSARTTELRLSVPLSGALLSVVAMGVGVGSSKTFVPAILVEEGVSSVSPYFLVYTVGAVVQRLGFGSLPDKIGRLRATILGLSGYMLSLVVIAVCDSTAITAAAFFLGMAHGLTYPASVALSIDLSPAEVRGRVTAWATGGYNLGFAMSASGLPYLEPLIGYRGLLVIGGLWLAATAVGLPRAVWSTTRSARLHRHG